MHTYGCALGVLRGCGCELGGVEGMWVCTGGVEGDVCIPMGMHWGC